ncbi:MAG: GtrA family protein [Balneolaceae bacterium]|nr:GtrA family protein [Balneolaceae bacterium]MCR9133715.1 GtrA family protein [bacterium]
MITKARIKDFIVPKLKYGASSVVATSIDYLVFFSVVHLLTVKYTTLAQVIAYSCGLLTNFFLQKSFVFELKRTVSRTFQLSLTFSLLGLVISSLLIYLFSQFQFFLEYLILTKVIVTGIMFAYNFYTKRFAFERKRLDDFKSRATNQSSK